MQDLERLTCARMRAASHPALAKGVVINHSTWCTDRCAWQPR
eukprot:COSAG02_NODE_50830_length_318_cov_0.680365_1_plen_41_part_01